MDTFVSVNNKDKYGEVLTPPFLVQQMLDDLKNIDNVVSLEQIKTVFEPGAGKGVFFDVFVNQNHCFSHHENFKYILNEINHEHLEDLQNTCQEYQQHTEIILQNCLELNDGDSCHADWFGNCDLVIGNLPFNCHTKKFVPSLAKNNKDDKSVTQSKSVTLWTKITHFCFEHVLKEDGYFFCIIPCIWLKPDRGGIYDLFTRNHSIILLKTFDCKTANMMFDYNCQTPMCYVLVQKTKMNNCGGGDDGDGDGTGKQFKLYDHVEGTYVDFALSPGKCIPTHLVSHFVAHSQYLQKRQIASCSQHVLKISTLHPQCLAGEILRFSKGGLEDYMDASGCEASGCEEKTYKIITVHYLIKRQMS